MAEKKTETKKWFVSKTVITSGVAFLFAVLTAAGVIDVKTGLKLEGLMVPFILVSLRLGDKPLTK